MATSTLYKHATIITVNKNREIILDGAMLVIGPRIALMDKTSVVLAHHDLPKDVYTVDLSGKIVIPGLINTHCHTVQSLLRGLAEDLWLHPWMCDAIWPLEASYQGDDGYHAARLTIAELLKGGTTCFLEAMLTHRAGFDNVARAVGESGVRACLGKLIKSPETNPSTNMTDARDADLAHMSLSSALAAHAAHHGTYSDRLHVWLAAGTPRGGTPLAAHAAIGAAAHAHGIGLTMHCAEAARDQSIYAEFYERRTPVQFCAEARLTGPRSVLAHMVHLDAGVDLPLLRASGTSVSHNPTSNCKLASGVARVPEMLEAGVNVALGTDGAPCNGSYDMFREMHLASVLQAGVRCQAGVLPATRVLEMATVNGARALGLEGVVGALEVGMKADFVVVGVPVSGAPFEEAQVREGGIDPVTVVVHSCTAADVEVVVVDGKVVVEGGRLVTMDEEEVVRNAREAIRGIRDRSGVKARPREGWSMR